MSDDAMHAAGAKSLRLSLLKTDLNAVMCKIQNVFNRPQTWKSFFPVASVTERSEGGGKNLSVNVDRNTWPQKTMRRDDGLTYGRATSERVTARENVSDDTTRRKKTKKNKEAVFVIPSVSPHSSFRGDNWISRRLILVCAGCRRDIPTADGRVSLGGGSEARRQKWDFHPFFSQTASDPQWQ